ncbi:MAG: Ppx/GppA family phosphatase [Alphaproteobacteria bacterium]|nr:Ppx/GppA family phosphatase [Alphaproteobacteria bacterium]
MTLSAQFYGVAAHDGKIGIIDIGSNSVRLVVYDGMKRAPMPLFNEKSMCELGKGVADTGTLNPEGVGVALECIARFLAMARVMDVVELYILATAAIRDAEDGKDFVRAIEKQHNVKVKVISGKQEAKLAAKGVQASLHNVHGLVGDLGGGSFELVRVEGDTIFEQESLTLGALRLKSESNDSITAATDRARKVFTSVDWLRPHSVDTFYAVGGSFRSLAHAYLLKTGYPLEVIHAYEIPVDKFLPFLRDIALQDERTIGDTEGIARKRAHSLPYAAVALAELLEYMAIKRVIFSTAGIREGYLYDQLSPYLKQEDGLIACCVDLATQSGRLAGYARDLFQWMNPLFEEETAQEQRMRFACCVLSEFAWRIHPQYRSEWMFTRIIQSSMTGMNHSERVMLANALYHRHTLKTPLKTKVLALLTARQKQWCQTMGHALALGFMVSGGMTGILQRTPLLYDGKNIDIEASAELQNLLTDTVRKRLDGLGDMLKAWRKRVR